MAKGSIIQHVSSSSPGQYRDQNGVVWAVSAISGGFAATAGGYGYTSVSRTSSTESGLYDIIDNEFGNLDPVTGKPKKNYLPWILGGGALVAGLVYFGGGMSKKRKK